MTKLDAALVYFKACLSRDAWALSDGSHENITLALRILSNWPLHERLAREANNLVNGWHEHGPIVDAEVEGVGAALKAIEEGKDV